MSTLQLRKIQPATIEFGIVGTSPLIQHAWSEKALEMLRMTAAERKKRKKEARNPEEEASAACYYTADGEHGVPVLAIKASIIDAAHKDYGIEKTTVRKGFFIPDRDGSGCVPMAFDDMKIREDIVRVGMSQTDLRYRPMFTGWSVWIEAQIDKELLSLQNVIDLVNRAGFSCGIGEWRPQKGGDFGRFEYDSSKAAVEEAA